MRHSWAAALGLFLLAVSAQGQINVEAKVDENSTVRMRFVFKDTAGAAVVPTAATWEWRTVQSNQVLVPTTPITGLVTSDVTVYSPGLFIPAGDLNAANPNAPDKVLVVLTLTYTWPGGTKSKPTYVYLNNVPGVLAPP
jgi:hypothetical protein